MRIRLIDGVPAALFFQMQHEIKAVNIGKKEVVRQIARERGGNGHRPHKRVIRPIPHVRGDVRRLRRVHARRLRAEHVIHHDEHGVAFDKRLRRRSHVFLPRIFERQRHQAKMLILQHVRQLMREEDFVHCQAELPHNPIAE